MAITISERELDFLLYEFLNTEALLRRERYADHSREVFAATLETARKLAVDLLAPHLSEGDEHEPKFEDGHAKVIGSTKAAWRAIADAGFLNAHWDHSEGGLQLPEVILRAAMSAFYAANVGAASYPMLTIGAANLLRNFGSQDLKDRYLAPLGDGRFAGTMALTEPSQGSALGDIRTVAVPQADGTYRLFGQKMFISGGDHDLTENIVHMVLARIQGAPAGTKGISLFLVPKLLPDAAGGLGVRNDVALAGLLHKMGWRNTTSTVLSFGDAGGAVGWLLGREHRGLAQMFQMMNEARIGVGVMSASIAWRGFSESLGYARERPQGRLPSNKDPLSPQAKLIEHADVRRLLLAQKTYAEGSLALCLYACSLFEDQHSHPQEQARDDARLLLDVLTPVVKSWPARYGAAANDMAIQVLGGAGYTRDYPVEQLYRDQRLNMIHEGAEAIHGIDLLGRKVVMEQCAGLRLFISTVRRDAQSAAEAGLRGEADALNAALDSLAQVSEVLMALQRSDPNLALANATIYLDAFGRVTLAWIWLQQGRVATLRLAGANADAADYYSGKLQAMRYFFQWELPQTEAQWALLARVDRAAFDMRDEWFV
ncbi:MAG TPA: acyl-CoA dehydrogenase [Paraburkholderia sp.]|uniref:acyl-CoA dehydrogenase n=1 Tax=Paraburkholderia sp. TaxID=1926495 RepID=UPI002B48D5F5|nr:acyl-CoA dehydrogenase [Paraburkholderia sp.]HKR47095.1 acyl-CoA dehydrogenase [Paraburkholderia sp.]